jgi:hypothetical protein
MKRPQTTMLGIARVIAGAAVLVFYSYAHAQDQHLAKTAKADHDVSVLSYARSNQNCDGIDPPKLYLDKPPEHGAVCFRINQVQLQNTVVGNLTQCLGRKIRGVTIVYRSAAKYRGSDELRYTVIFPELSHHVDVGLTVVLDRPNASDTSLREINGSAEEGSQSPGPMPACTVVTS